MDPVLSNAQRQPAYVPCVLVRMELRSGVVRLTDGGFAVYGGELYLAAHPGIGSLDTIGQLTEGGSGTTTRSELMINAESDVAVAALADPLNQTGLVQWWEGSIDPATGLLIGQPLLKFQGQYDKARFSVDESSWSVVIECGTESELQLIPNTDWRANDAMHRKIWGELGHANVSRLTDADYWRTEAPSGAIGSSRPAPVGGGGGGLRDSLGVIQNQV